MTAYNVLEFGARADGRANDAAAIQKAIDECFAAGGGRVLLPGGCSFLAGPVELRSNVELRVETGSRLAAIPDRSIYTEDGLPGVGGSDGRKWLHATGAANVSVTGGGVIDGRGVEFMSEELPHVFRTEAARPFVVSLEDCRQVTFRGVTLRDSPFWAMHLVGCDDVLIDGIRILNNLKVPNSDGIDPDRCSNVRIVGCHIECGDDCICPKSEAEFEKYGACENFLVTGCTLISTSCAIKLGSGSHGAFRNMVFDSCAIHSSHRGLGIQFRDGGSVENVLFSNMTVETRFFAPTWWGDATPIYVTAFERSEGAPLGKIRNVRFRDILCRAENGVYVASQPPEHIEGVTFEGVSVELAKRSKHPGGRYDRRPCAAEPGVVESPTSGFHIEGASDVTVRNCSVAWGEGPPDYYRHALYAKDSPGLAVENLKGDSARPGEHDAIVTE